MNILSIVGIVVTLGISVNDSILKISTVLELLKKGIRRDAAIEEASKMRFTPIVLTSLTTIASCLPFYFGNGAGSEIQRAMSAAMIGGLFLSTFGALYMVPSLMHLYLKLADHTANGPVIPVGRRLAGKQGR